MGALGSAASLLYPAALHILTLPLLIPVPVNFYLFYITSNAMSDAPSAPHGESENTQMEAAVNTTRRAPTDADIDPVLLHSSCIPMWTESGRLIPQNEFIVQL